MTTRDITDTFEELYGAQVSPTLVSKVTAAVQQELEACQARALKMYIQPYILIVSMSALDTKAGYIKKKSVQT